MFHIKNRLSSIIVTAFLIGTPLTAMADVITDWNAQAMDTAKKAKWSPTRVFRNIAIVQVAVFDAVNAVDRRYKPYIYGTLAAKGASVEAAASQAAFKVLSTMAPEQSDVLAARNNAILATVTDATARADGVAAGDQAVAAVLANRATDGFDDTTTDQPIDSSEPGRYRFTATGPLFSQNYPRMRPFGFTDSTKFRLPPPAPINSAQYARDLAEVKALGDARAHPSEEHVLIARFHAPNGAYPWNDIARQLATAAPLSVVDEARLFALLGMALSDAFEASFESKNYYQFWRPLTAIRASSDTEWDSIIAAPLFAEYPCMHCAIGSAAETVLTRIFPQSLGFNLTFLDKKPRHYNTISAFAEEEAESRIMGGVHFRWSLVAGNAQGHEVALHDLQLLPKE